MPNINKDFIVHPRKHMSPAPTVDWRGNPMPKTLDEVYGTYSDAKKRAYEYCRKLFIKYDGWNFCISGYNCMTFSVAFDFIHPDKGCLMTARITKMYNHAYYL